MILYLSMLDEKVDKVNFEQIYRKYHDDIYKRVYGILKNEDDVMDAMQETWIRVLNHMKDISGKDEHSMKAYVMAIARNQAISILRIKRKEERCMCDADIMELVDDSYLFDACEQEGVSKVLDCFKLLSVAQRDVLMMYYYHHHSLKEIAKIFGISEAVATSRWAHGRKRLISILKRRGYHE